MQTNCKGILEELLDGRHLSQFTRLVKLLLGTSQPVPAEGVSSRVANNVTFQVDSQNLRNRDRDLFFQNSRLDKVGNRSQFDTDRTKYETGTEAGGMSAGFSDISGS